MFTEPPITVQPYQKGSVSYNLTIRSSIAYDTVQSGSGKSGGGDDMYIKVARLESDMEHIKKAIAEIKDDVREIKRDARTDFRMLFGALIFVALGLAGLMSKGFHWL